MEILLKKVKKVLIINNLYSLIVNDNVDIKLIQQLYVSTFILNKLNSDLVIDVSDKSLDNYQFLWKESSNLKTFLDPFIIKKDWKDFDLSTYDIIILHIKDEKLIAERLKQLKEDVGDFAIPKIFAITDYNEREIPLIIASSIDALFETDTKLLIDESFFNEISVFKEEIRKNYAGFKLEDQEYFHRKILSKITKTNELAFSSNVKKILFLDDQKRRFYIGDSYLWLMNIRRNLFEIFPTAEICVNCQNTERCRSLRQIFDGSWDEQISLSNLLWDDIKFADFDLVLYHNDLTIPFLNYVEYNYDKVFNETQIYSFFDTHLRADDNYPIWNFSHLFKKKNVSGNFINSILKKKLYSELSISDNERHCADEWFEKRGINFSDKIVVFITNASTKEKMLTIEDQYKFIRSIILAYNCHVLLFDDRSEHLRERIDQNLELNISRKVLISDLPSLRKDLSLMASKYIKAIIGPCTGLMHLANGIYNYFLNKKLLRRSELPLLFVYTGNLHGFSEEYHPRRWWANTLVKGAVGIRNEKNEVLLISVDKLSYEVSDFNRLSVALDHVKSEMLMDYITLNFTKINKLMGT